ncbi:MAG: BamA/TamA family outer membrane protein [Elusimicrobiales bacterium]|jgi:hypothetical protein
MTRKLPALLFLLALCAPDLSSQPGPAARETELGGSAPAQAAAGPALKARGPAAKKKKPHKSAKLKDEVVGQEPKTRAELVKPLEIAETAPKENILARTLGAITINTAKGPIIPFPVVDSNKDMGVSFGIMPIMAIRGGPNDKTIKAVLAPSATYNEYLRTTLTYRQYIFPDEQRFFLLRASYSQKVEREFIIYYYTPQAWGSEIRVGAEAKNWVTGKPSFYGLGIDSSRKDRANYALNMTGEEFTVDLPLVNHHFFFNFNHALYLKRISDGPQESGQVSGLFPALFNQASKENTFLTHRFALVYDDTDHPFLPKLGTYIAASVNYSDKSLASDFNYRTYVVQLKHYYNYKEEGKYVTAIHYLYQFTKGDALPFYALPQLGESTGLRMAGDGRFVDRGKFVFTVEERITLSRSPFMKFISESEIAPFLDIGTVFPKPSEFSARNLKYSPGISARIVIRPQVVGTLDFAFGSEGTNAIIKVGYPF